MKIIHDTKSISGNVITVVLTCDEAVTGPKAAAVMLADFWLGLVESMGATDPIAMIQEVQRIRKAGDPSGTEALHLFNSFKGEEN